MIYKPKDKNTILILTANFGAGHVSAAHAIKEYILEKDSNYNIIIQNFISASVPKMNQPLVKIYETQTKYIPSLYNCYYYLKKSFDPRFDVAYKMYANKLSPYILDTNPQVIISTFPLAAACVYDFKLKNPTYNTPTITVVTDVVDSSEWVFPDTNMYFVPSKEIKNRYIHKGIDPSKIQVTGVPIKRDFSFSRTISAPEKYKILLMGGGRGLFDMDIEFMYFIDDLVKNNPTKLDVTIVTGKNSKLYEQLTHKKPLKNIKVLGFVNNMSELMKEHNIIFTKPGGATLFESISSEIPVIVKLPKVGQEIENAKFIVDKGIGIVYQYDNDLKDIFYSIVNNNIDSRYIFMTENIKDVKDSISPNKIGSYVIDLINKNKR